MRGAKGDLSSKKLRVVKIFNFFSMFNKVKRERVIEVTVPDEKSKLE